ncbi:hypothetical protein C8R45DRAFT_118270 [Mycena sanguinolenta]|nr:hypothetical protein C8R45DRAFT_194282 [Mycena sanguinolenta]KAJ6450672.1 hypothetical protein C8R45DRAFT_118270 [Mycena sanguinolenta]
MVYGGRAASLISTVDPQRAYPRAVGGSRAGHYVEDVLQVLKACRSTRSIFIRAWGMSSISFLLTFPQPPPVLFTVVFQNAQQEWVFRRDCLQNWRDSMSPRLDSAARNESALQEPRRCRQCPLMPLRLALSQLPRRPARCPPSAPITTPRPPGLPTPRAPTTATQPSMRSRRRRCVHETARAVPTTSSSHAQTRLAVSYRGRRSSTCSASAMEVDTSLHRFDASARRSPSQVRALGGSGASMGGACANADAETRAGGEDG